MKTVKEYGHWASWQEGIVYSSQGEPEDGNGGGGGVVVSVACGAFAGCRFLLESNVVVVISVASACTRTPVQDTSYQDCMLPPLKMSLIGRCHNGRRLRQVTSLYIIAHGIDR